MISKRIEIVSTNFTGLSSMGKQSRDGILDVLSRHYSDVKITMINSISDMTSLLSRKPDLVFLGMRFIPSNPDLGHDDPVKLWLSELLDEYGIAHTCSGKSAHVLENSKPFAKQSVIDAGMRSSPFLVSKTGQSFSKKEMNLMYPLFIKPSNRGGGKGVDTDSVVHNFLQLESKVASISSAHNTTSLIEEYLPGREFSVGILRDYDFDKFFTMPIELIAEPDSRGLRMLSSAVKSSNSEAVCGVDDILLSSKLSDLALGVFKVLGGRYYGRIDIRLDMYGEPVFLEANLIPSLIEGYGSFPKACLINKSMSFEQMILAITNLGLSRKFASVVENPNSSDLVESRPVSILSKV